jgi:hypothetical protein
MKYTSQQQVRRAFWQSHPTHYAHAKKWQIVTAGHDRHTCETRTAFVDFVDHLAKSGAITERLAQRVTL